MTELQQKVNQKIQLDKQLESLMQEQQQLKKAVFDQHITTHNTQVDADALERFGPKRLFLQITGKYEEQLEEAQRAARAANSQHSYSAARLENVNTQIAQVQQQLVQINRQWNNLLPQLTDRLRQARYEWMEALCRTL